MNLKRCEKGHFYDEDKSPVCPACQSEGKKDDSENRDVTVFLNSGKSPTSESLKESEGSRKLDESIRKVISNDDMGKTVSFSDVESGISPVVGWLVCVNGINKGKSYELKSGKNFIGRARDMDVVLSGDESISRNRHAIVIFEPKAGIFIAQPGESRELFYLNDKVVLNNEQMKKNDSLLIGNTRLILIPCCDEAFRWEDYS